MRPSPNFTGPRDKAAFDECTRDPIFLLQVRRWTITGEPIGYEYVDEIGYLPEGTERNEDGEYEVEPLTMKQLEEMGCASAHWETDSFAVWLSREEAEAFAKSHEYNYPDGWQVYCTCANGQLAELLKAHGDAYWPKPEPELDGAIIQRLREDLDLQHCLRHTLGDLKYDRNYFVTSPDCANGKTLEAGVALGLVFRGRKPSELSGGFQSYHVTHLGRRYLLAALAVQPVEA